MRQLVIEFPTQRKYEQVSKLNEQDGILNDVPLQMIAPVDAPNRRTKNTEIKKAKNPKGKSMEIYFSNKDKEAFNCKEIIELLKTVTDDGPCYEKLVKEFIVNTTAECNVEGGKMYDRGKCVIFSPSNFNDYLVRSKYAGYDKASSIYKIMTKENEVEEDEEAGSEEE
ncbi:hypothetical protein KIW84_075620 [Lathyrus oleraceus]|uniref:Uncharacterized protein n=1 Tax=Pisum sativum TaxID=3888 RepID=A0A9D4VX57_PEA|nr:hypothetical protein KIW84_075620 [Pisum sativum]